MIAEKEIILDITYKSVSNGFDDAGTKELSLGEIVEQILEIQDSLNLGRWSGEDYLAQSQSPDCVFLAAIFAVEVCGFLLARLVPGAVEAASNGEFGESDVINFGVTKKFQRKGIGRRLFRAMLTKLMEKRIRMVWLEVRESNSKAIKFYTKEGFQIAQIRRNFYSHPIENGLVMKLDLTS